MASEPICYFMPLTLAWENSDTKRLHAMKSATIANVRQQAHIGILADAFADDAFCLALVLAIGSGQTLACAQGKLCFTPTLAYASLTEQTLLDLTIRPCIQGSNTAVLLGDRLFLKAYRHLQIGINPELELGRYLTDVCKFTHLAPVEGAVEYITDDGKPMTLALLQGQVENQGDFWCYTLDYLKRFLEENRAIVVKPVVEQQMHNAYLLLIHTLAQRTGELHNALNTVTGNADFDPEPVTEIDLGNWLTHVEAELKTTLDQLEQRLAKLPGTTQTLAQQFIGQRTALADKLKHCIAKPCTTSKSRYHGDFHLGQVLLTQNDFIIIDFEGEPGRPLNERRCKHSPLRDVAGMLLSFSYAAQTAMALETTEQPESLAKITPLLQTWEADVSKTFLTTYAETVNKVGAFADGSALHNLLDLFLLEKLFYEVRYELNERPEWVVIPLQGIVDVIKNKLVSLR